ncbi:MAG TPA: endonuclease NucS [Caldisericia bacterium]|nr:endonuclease NucS [Caldisericia bacterium]HPF49774.1 endonuclease NucS [Caldisericia bacterium]HPI84335.1 endonuclease NucS [Caldisericia bacterium]HPQ93762.1 endonuclease NucS [Caldisericia bacterium]HRV74814.1 endonuclease NucS [Caldisericia bacterium]
MLEKDIENLIAKYPDEFFKGEGFKLIDQQYSLDGKRFDILFEDRHKRKVIVEVKRGIPSRDATGQLVDYYGLLKDKYPSDVVELVLCANIIPAEKRAHLERFNIECKELGIARLSEVARKYNYTFIDDNPGYKNVSQKNPKIDDNQTQADEKSVWIFQANPDKYDIVKALSDGALGGWRVNQHKKEVKKGHLVLIWVSGKEAGIYAIARIESDLMKGEAIDDADDEYNIELKRDETVDYVDLAVINNMINKPILKEKILTLDGMDKLSVIRSPQGTNFPVTDEQWRAISDSFL